MAVNEHNVDKGLIALLQADSTLRGYIGNPVRIRTRVEPDITFPWVYMEKQRSGFLPQVKRPADGRKFIESARYAWTIYSRSLSKEEASNIRARLEVILKTAPSASTITGAAIKESIPRAGQCLYDPTLRLCVGFVEFEFHIEET